MQRKLFKALLLVAFFVPAFSASAAFSVALSNSGNITVGQGSSGATNITVSLLSGITGPVTFSVSGLPLGATSSFSPPSCNPTCSTVITISTLASTPIGTSIITVTATGGDLPKTTTFSLIVDAPSTPPASTKFSINDRVQVSSGPLNVRLTPSTSGTSLGTEATGNLGTVIGGPINADNNNWWQITYDNGISGWSAEDYLVKYTAPTQTQTTGNVYYVDSNLASDCVSGSYSVARRDCSGSDGKAWKSLASVFGAWGTTPVVMSPGATLYIRSGTYTSCAPTCFTVYNLHGTASAPITITPYGSETVTINGVTHEQLFSFGESSYIVLDGKLSGRTKQFIIDGGDTRPRQTNPGPQLTDTYAENGIYIDNGSNHITIKRIEIKNIQGTGISSSPGCCSANPNTGYNLFSELYMRHGTVRGYGLYLGHHDEIVEKSEITDWSTACVQIYTGDARYRTDNTILRWNWCHDLGGYVDYPTPGVRQTGAFWLYNGNNLQAYGNIISGLIGRKHGPADDAAPAIGVGPDASQTKIYGNTVINNEVGGLQFDPAATGEIKNNIFWNNCYTSACQANYGYRDIDTQGANTIVSNNLCTSSSAGGCSVSSNPLLVNPSSGDFRLQSSSPAINAGASLGFPYDKDFDGVQRPVGSAYDIGTYEYGGVVTTPTPTPTPTITTPTPTPTSTPTPTATTQSPYSGTPVSIPGTIQAENYDNGGEGIAYYDIDSINEGASYRLNDGVDLESSSAGGYNVGWMDPGEWTEYTINVPTTGTYNIQTQVAASGAGGTFHIEFDGVNKTGTITIPSTGGWQTWTTLTIPNVSLSQGQQIMKLFQMLTT